MFSKSQSSVSPEVAQQELPQQELADLQEITLRSSESRTVSSEESETRVVNGRRFHKRTVTTESRESKTEVHESTLPATGPIVARPAAHRTAAAAESPTDVSLPPQVRLSIANVDSTEDVGSARFVGDYILDPMVLDGASCDLPCGSGDASAPMRRWQLSFPAHCGLFVAELMDAPLADGRRRLLARLRGAQNGPQWSGEATHFNGPTVLRSDPRQVGVAIAGCYWPSHVTVSPLQLPSAKQRFHIPPESTLEEILILSGSCGSDGSFDPCHVDPCNVYPCPVDSGSNGPDVLFGSAESGG